MPRATTSSASSATTGSWSRRLRWATAPSSRSSSVRRSHHRVVVEQPCQLPGSAAGRPSGRRHRASPPRRRRNRATAVAPRTRRGPAPGWMPVPPSASRRVGPASSSSSHGRSGWTASGNGTRRTPRAQTRRAAAPRGRAEAGRLEPGRAGVGRDPERGRPGAYVRLLDRAVDPPPESAEHPLSPAKRVRLHAGSSQVLSRDSADRPPSARLAAAEDRAEDPAQDRLARS